MGEAGPALSLPTFGLDFSPRTQSLRSPERRRQGLAELASSSGSRWGRQMPEQGAIQRGSGLSRGTAHPPADVLSPPHQPHATQRC